MNNIPPKKLYILFFLFLYCFMLLTLAAIKNTQLVGIYGWKSIPFSPWWLLGIVAVAFILTMFSSKTGMTICAIFAVAMCYTALKGYLRGILIDPMQNHIAFSLVLISFYGWFQLWEANQ